MEQDIVFGANIIENLTTGMYENCQIMYREYIQNSADAIDQAIDQGILEPKSAYINIWIDPDERKITIEDNGTGIQEGQFFRAMGHIADSQKKIGVDKGFRGIGRICGLAYCDTLTFQTKAAGENITSILTCDATKMREMIEQNQSKEKHFTALEIIKKTFHFSTLKSDEYSSDQHFFKVTLHGIRKDHEALLQSDKIREYLSFVCPVSYQPKFTFKQKLHDYAKQINQIIPEYKITLDGTPILKNYGTWILNKSNEKVDDIVDIQFKEIYNDQHELLAWLWYGVHSFKGALTKSTNPMWGLRYRAGNIQIGTEYTLRNLFSEGRGNSYYVGEIFAVHKSLIPNSRRDNFTENDYRTQLEEKLKEYFEHLLYTIYRTGSEVNSTLDKIDKARYDIKVINKQVNKGELDEDQATELIDEIKDDIKDQKDKLTKIKTKHEDKPEVLKIISHIEKTHKAKPRDVTKNGDGQTGKTVTKPKTKPVPDSGITVPQTQITIHDYSSIVDEICTFIKSLVAPETASYLEVKIKGKFNGPKSSVD